MRFCPFCGGENGDDAASCAACGRKLPAAVRRLTTAAAITPAPGVRAFGERKGDSTVETGSTSGGSVSPGAAAAPSTAPASPASSTSPASPTSRPASDASAPDAPIVPAGAPPPRRKLSSIPPPVPRGQSAGPNGAARAADGTPATPTPTPLPPPASPTPTSVPYGRDATDSALATKVVTLPEIEEARRNLPPIPPVPDGGPFDWARYAVTLEWARWQRRKIMRTLSVDTGKDTTGLDGVFGELGRTARAARIEGRVFADENQGLDEAERRRVFAEQACADLTGKRADENAKYEGIQHDLAARATERESELRAATSELERLDGQRRALRDKKRDLDKKQKAIYKSADEREEQASRSQMGDSRQALRQAAAELRREAGRLDADLQDVDGRLGGLERPIADAQALVEKTRSDYSSAKRDLDNAREGHRHRVAELEAEQARRSRELLQAEAEINRRLVTLGTIVNLNRIGRPEFQPLYERADDLRGAISAREAEVDRLEAEREAFDNPSRVRGFVVLAIATLALVTLIWVIVAMAL